MAQMNSSPSIDKTNFGINKSFKRLSEAGFLNRLKIGPKLRLGFGILILLILLTGLLNYIGTSRASSSFNRTKDLRLPTALVSSEAEGAMLSMLANIQAYLSLGEPQFREEYSRAREDFETQLAQLESLAANGMGPAGNQRLTDLKIKFEAWGTLPDQMFALRDDPLANQPAQRILAEEGQPRMVAIIGNITGMIEQQASREPSLRNLGLFKDLTDFRSAFSGMSAGIQGYLNTLDPIYKDEYLASLAASEDAWARVIDNRELLTREQVAHFERIVENREAFSPLPEQMFAAAESERVREDLYLLSTQAEPLAAEILQILDELVNSQQELLQADVNEGGERLAATQVQTIVGSIVISILGLVLAFIFGRNITEPIGELTQVTTQIAAGDLSVQAQVKSRDEVGTLAATFNAMTDRLQRTITDLQEGHQRLKTIANINRQLTNVLDLGELLNQVVTLTKETFDYYHVHIYLLDESGETLVMTEGYGQAGAEMKREGHSIPLKAAQSLVARAAREKRVITVENVREDPYWLPNSLLPETRSEMAVPVIFHQKLIGVLDVQADRVGDLTQDDEVTLQTLADQVAVAVDSARRFEETAHALAEAEELQRRYLQTGWQDYLPRRQRTVYQQAQPDVTPIDEHVLTQVKQKTAQGQMAVITPAAGNGNDNQAPQSALAAPLAIRGQVIGTLRIHDTEHDRQWTAEEIALIESISEQMSLAIENARLFDTTQQRAAREQLTRQIADKMRAAPNVDTIIQTGLTELAKALQVSRAYVKLSPQLEQEQGSNEPMER